MTDKFFCSTIPNRIHKMKNIKETTEKIYGKYPETVLQFGEGNFLRAFADWMIDLANENGSFKGSIVLCQPIAQGLTEKINTQNGLYTLAMRGIKDGKATEEIRKITSVSRCINPYEDYQALKDLAKSKDLKVIISNTTEAGIAYKQGDKLTDTPPSSFPAKITAFLYERFKAFNGDEKAGLLFLPVELIDRNGDKLKEIVLKYAAEWKLPQDFIRWVNTANKFTNTLVDRIVTGYPKDQLDYFAQKLGYQDDIIVTSEIFNLWVIEGKKEWADILPIHKTKANVMWVDDVTPYKMRKVRILNGGHTSTVPAAWLAGHNIVLDFINDPVFKKYLDILLFEEVIPTLPLPKDELENFANAVKDRFSNPYIKHKLLDISLNCCSKFNARCLPSLLQYHKQTGKLPKLLTFSLAAFIKFYDGKQEENGFFAIRKDATKYQIKDSPEVINFMAKAWQNKNTVAKAVLSNKDFWGGKDLTLIPELEKQVQDYLNEMACTDIKTIISRITK